jgi:Tol biopolymer transport system component
MSLTPGTRLGPYEIQGAIGAGGMGEVYKARDTQLKRDVALKVLPAEVARDGDRLARFQREAQLLAALNHPHIAQIHGLADAEGVRAIVMELVEGPTLSERIARGPLPLGEALPVATQLAEALEYAHERGIIHRDLKPGNVMLTKTGAKLLDFGLAKLKGHGEQAAVTLFSSAPTERTPLTAEGAIIGTLQYMAPEQVEGKPADARTDLWALGAILYEMVTGQRAFEGTSAASLIGHIMNSEPPAMATRRPLTPPTLERLVRRCLAKDPDERWDSAHDVADELRWLASVAATTGPGSEADVRTLSAVTARVHLWKTAVALLALIVAGMAGAIGYSRWRERPAPTVVRSTIELPAGAQLTVETGLHPFPTRTEFALSPDGGHLAFSAVPAETTSAPRLYLRPLDRTEAEPVKGTEGAREPFFSPDGQWVGFWANGMLYKVSLQEKVPQDLAACPSLPKGISWGDDGEIYWGLGGGGIGRVPASGGPVEHVTKVDPQKESSHNFPVVLPGGQAILFTVTPDEYGDRAHVEVASLPAGDRRRTVIDDAADARYLRTGHLAFFRQGTVFVVPFNAKTLHVAAGATAVLMDVAQAVASWFSNDLTLAGQLAVSEQGTLAYIASPPVRFPDFELVSVNRKGQVTALAAPPKGYREHVEASPDGSRLAVSVQTTKSIRLFLYDTIRGTLEPVGRESADEEVILPVWAKDGRLAFQVRQGRVSHLAIGRPDVASPAEVIADSEGFAPSSWSPDGQRLIGTKANDIWMYSPNAPGPKFTPVVETPASEHWPAWSPDGRWLAYVSEREEVYVQPYPGPGARILVSTNGGRSPAWNPQGKELFYVEAHVDDDLWRMMTVDMTAPLKPGRPAPLFSFPSSSLPLASCNPTNCYSVAPNGAAFFGLRMVPRTPSPVTHINLIQNWFEELKAKVPRQ